MAEESSAFTSSTIAEEAEKMFPSEVKTIKNVKMLHKDQIAHFLDQMEKAHKEAAYSKLIFKRNSLD